MKLGDSSNDVDRFVIRPLKEELAALKAENAKLREALDMVYKGWLAPPSGDFDWAAWGEKAANALGETE